MLSKKEKKKTREMELTCNLYYARKIDPALLWHFVPNVSDWKDIIFDASQSY